MGITGKREWIAGPAASAGLRYGLAFASVAAAFALVESQRWWRAAAYSVVCSVVALGVLWVYTVLP